MLRFRAAGTPRIEFWTHTTAAEAGWLAAVGVIVCKTILYGTLSNTLIETTLIMLNYVCLKLKSTLRENIKINFSSLDYFLCVFYLAFYDAS
jgi:hypothetical protein